MAVADNQPAIKMDQNRGNDNHSFSDYAAQLRGFIHHSMGDSMVGDLLEAQFSALAQALFRLQFEHNRVFRQLCQHRQLTLESRPHWKQIPAVATRVFKELELTCLPEGRRPFVFYTSGTTRVNPGRHFHDDDSLAIYEASLVPWFRKHLLPEAIQMVMVSLTPSQLSAPNSSLVHMLATVAREYGRLNSDFVGCTDGGGAWQINFPRLREVIERALAGNQPVAFWGTAFNFVQVLDYCQANQIRYELPPGSRVMETGGYKGRSRSLSKTSLQAMISQAFGIPRSHIICEYGMCELSSQAYDAVIPLIHAAAPTQVLCPAPGAPGRVFHFPPWAKALVISPETGGEVGDGDSGLIQVIDLANVWSVMAVQTEDLGVRRGNGFELVGRSIQTEPRGCSLNS